MRYCFRGYHYCLCVDTLILFELNPSQPTVSGDILILFPDRLTQVIYLNLTRLLRKRFHGHFNSSMGIEGIE